MLRVIVRQMSICVKVLKLYSHDYYALLNVSYSSIGKRRLQGELQNEESPGKDWEGEASERSTQWPVPAH